MLENAYFNGDVLPLLKSVEDYFVRKGLAKSAEQYAKIMERQSQPLISIVDDWHGVNYLFDCLNNKDYDAARSFLYGQQPVYVIKG